MIVLIDLDGRTSKGCRSLELPEFDTLGDHMNVNHYTCKIPCILRGRNSIARKQALVPESESEL